MRHHAFLRTTALATGVAAMTLCFSLPATGQPAPPDQGQYDQGQYDQGQYGQGQYGAPPPPPGQYDQAQPQYDQGQYDQGQYDQGQSNPGRYNVPPPPGYQPQDEQYDASAPAREQDDRYAYEAEQWAARNCVDAHARDTTAGVVIGGILGAIVGSNLSGRYDRGAGAVAGGALGAVAGGAIGSSAADSNPNCPPGYAMRAGAPAFYPGPVYGDVVYAAPGWYDPWISYGHHWIYRPYPYHRYWYHSHRR
ncbi:MAG: glycine zipper 2TM domain-containing protein [Caulobacteraceae bacterium]|nr:glycine zipper 2TM domain-containing protein [Caulobacteraceae bacterium]